MFVVVPLSGRLRGVVEDAIRQLYLARYNACLSSFARTIFAELDDAGRVMCAAGIRFGSERLFSECYFDQPMEKVLRNQTGQVVSRHRIVEVSHLAAASPGRSIPFVQNLIGILRSLEIDWAIFTATKPLRALVRRHGLPMLELGRAERSRVGDPDSWGRYFDYDPRVMAVGNRASVGAGRFTAVSRAVPYTPIDARVF